MNQLLACLLTLLFSLSGPAMGGYSDFWQSSNAARGTTQLEFAFVNDIPRLKTMLGSGRDVASYLGKPDYNVLQMDRGWPLAIRKEYNRLWLDGAIDRGDELILKTDPIKWDRFMRDIGKESFYNEVDLPRLLQRGVIDDAIRDY